MRRLTHTPGGASIALVVALALLAQSCTSVLSRSAETETAHAAPRDLPEAALLDVGVPEFDPGLPEDPEDLDDRTVPEIRRAESRYLAWLLRQTLAETGQWGAVRIVPAETEGVDLVVKGTIDASDGDRLALDIVAVDATGREWIDETYVRETTEEDFSAEATRDPYQRMFNTIANDLVAARDELSTKELTDVRRVSELRFARSLAPDAFEGYLDEEDGHYEIRRLPALNDPMMIRLSEVRSRNATFLETFNAHYDRFGDEMTPTYGDWRRYARDEAIAYREIKNAERLRWVGAIATLALTVAAGAYTGGALRDVLIVAGSALGVAQIDAALDRRAEAEIHEAALGELDASFRSEVAPLVVETEDDTVRLEGSAAEQYRAWQRILAELYRAESAIGETTTVYFDPNALDEAPAEP